MKRFGWIFAFYNLILYMALPFVFLYVLIRWRGRFSKGLERWDERWGKVSLEAQKKLRTKPEWWWIHAVSLGEVKAIEAFLVSARSSPVHGILLSVITPEALTYADERQLADIVIAAPIDLPWAVRRVFKTIRPKLFVSVESEFWPNLLRGAKEAKARVALINGRLSERSFRSYRKIKPILGALWSCFDIFAVREDQDARRLQALGVPIERIHVTGNLKYDLSIRVVSPSEKQRKRGLTLVVGSTREKEEMLLFPVIEKLRKRFSDLCVIWAPRHTERIGELEAYFAEEGAPCHKKSTHADRSGSPGIHNVLWDSMGDLIDAYQQADVAIIGGSFVPRGGQNPIEPAALGVPVIFGPSMDNFHAIAESLVKKGGARQVSIGSLESCLSEILDSSAIRKQMGISARKAVESQQGATDRTLQLLERLTHA